MKKEREEEDSERERERGRFMKKEGKRYRKG
jgi:hypothetical protein